MIFSSRFLPKTGCSPASAALNCHGPLRFFHFDRTCWGRGYSGSGFFSSSRSPHGVVSRWVDSFCAYRTTWGTVPPPSVRPPSPS